jgi:hypothetical protein
MYIAGEVMKEASLKLAEIAAEEKCIKSEVDHRKGAKLYHFTDGSVAIFKLNTELYRYTNEKLPNSLH